ncbi:MAG: hypothetical protein CVU05_14390 [Bacteroidetes bacterium HGW-Bacteroidetes-21]|jgi:tetratricopeptide (TPR) repeat protein|nr:MAG: hypothetical protein CVU05_14390 [Bacteroidetes bacterium HGW-Bacteroidetes-21]
MKDKKILPLILLLLAGLTLFVYSSSLYNDFTNWDDPAYVTNNDLIKSFSAENINSIFSEYHNGHYHPLTWLTLSFAHKMSKDNAGFYHFLSLLLHFFNILLVFFFIRRIQGKIWIPLFVAVIFGFHPLAVESVAWVSELKTVLYAFFFLISMHFYLSYTEKGKFQFYLFALVFFILSCFSKSQAVVLPIVLMAIDYLTHTKMRSLSYVAKAIPFFTIAVTFGFLAIGAQKEIIQQEHIQPVSDNLSWAVASFGMYLIKMVFPFGLSALYPYPPDGNPDSMLVISGLVLFAGFLVFVYKLIRKDYRKTLFGLAFFIINLFFVLKLFNIPAGPYFMADRYAYLPIIGFAFAVFSLFPKVTGNRLAIYRVLISGMLIGLVFLCHERTKVWKNSITLWSDVLENYNYAPVAYINRGNAYRDNTMYKQAIEDYNAAEKLNPGYFTIFANRGHVYLISGKPKNAIKDFSSCLSINPNYFESRYNRALAYDAAGMKDSALVDYQTVIQTKPDFIKAWLGRGNIYFSLGQDSLAKVNYNEAIRLDPKNAEAYYNRGNIFAKNQKHKEALADYNKAISLSNYKAEYFMNRANTYYYLNDFQSALNDFNVIISSNPEKTDARMNRGTLSLRMGKYKEAYDDFSYIVQYDKNNADAWLKRGMCLLNTDQPSNACNDFHIALKLGHPLAQGFISEHCKM